MSPASYQLPDQNFSDKKSPQIFSEGFGSGSRTRTYDLRVMSPTSYQLLHPALFLVFSTFGHNSEWASNCQKCNLHSVLIGLQRYNSFLCSPNKILIIFLWRIRQVS